MEAPLLLLGRQPGGSGSTVSRDPGLNSLIAGRIAALQAKATLIRDI
jgi:hypothetical protein